MPRNWYLIENISKFHALTDEYITPVHFTICPHTRQMLTFSGVDTMGNTTSLLAKTTASTARHLPALPEETKQAGTVGGGPSSNVPVDSSGNTLASRHSEEPRHTQQERHACRMDYCGRGVAYRGDTCEVCMRHLSYREEFVSDTPSTEGITIWRLRPRGAGSTIGQSQGRRADQDSPSDSVRNTVLAAGRGNMGDSSW
jgi:hypothetical protein